MDRVREAQYGDIYIYIYICRSVVNVVISAQVPYEKGQFLSGFKNYSFCKSTMSHGDKQISVYLYLSSNRQLF
jgi:hypothetical protein